MILTSLPDWAKTVPYQVKKIAVEDAYKAFSNGVKKFKKLGKPFELSFRSLKNPKQSCFIPKSALSEKGIYWTKVGSLKMAEKLPEQPLDSRLLCEHGRWYLSVPFKETVTMTENQSRVVALDPGIRTFMTGFSQTEVFKVGVADFSRIARLSRWMDKLQSKISGAKHRQKYRFKKALARMKHKVWDLIDELHWKTIKFLTENYDVVLLPTFETSQMVSKSKRKIRSKTVRAMMTFSFHKFGMRLQQKLESVGKVLIKVNEAYTSKTASWSGQVVKIGSSKRITSNGITLDRDVNGARGIFLRALVEVPSLRWERAFVNNSTELFA